MTALRQLMTCFLVAALSFQRGSCFKPSRIGDLIPSGSPGSVSGLVFLLNHTALYIRDFELSVTAGTRGYFCAGNSTSNRFVVSFIPDGLSSSSSFSSGFSSADIELSLPAGVTVASLAWVGVCSDSNSSPVLASVVVLPQLVSNVPCNTTLIGELPSDSNNISGRVYLLDRITFAVLGFSYDGMAADPLFWVGASDTPTVSGQPCTYEDNIVTSLPAFMDQDVVVHIPRAIQGTVISYLAVWSRSSNVNLGHVTTALIPTPPPPTTGTFVAPFETHAHNVQGKLFALTEKVIVLSQFFFDGNAPAVHFRAIFGGTVYGSSQIVPDETGSTESLQAYTNRTITLTLPGTLTVHNVNYFAVWCDEFNINFGDVNMRNPIILGNASDIVEVPTLPPVQDCPVLAPEIPVNCKQLSSEVTMSWVVDDSNNVIIIKLCGCVLSGNYVAFGISGSDQAVQMVGGDATWTWLDNEGVHARDLHLSSYSQCLISRQSSGQVTQIGACPDMQDDVTSVSGFRDGCTTCITFKRTLNTSDPTDRPFLLGRNQYVIWAMGPVGSISTPLGTTIPVPFRHYANAARTANMTVNFSRPAVDECTLQCSQCEVQVQPWPQPVLPHTTNITTRIGPSGGERGHAGITGTSGWGISWYLNGLLIPSITMYRGTTYTFMVEGGLDPSNQARYHPFYITSSDRGGYLAKSSVEQQRETIYAGIDESGNPLGVGRFCEYRNTASDRSGEFTSFDQYVDTLTLECDAGEPGIFTWTPDENTPDTVYYQCATHQFLGWKISVVDAPTEEPVIPLTIEFISDTPRITGNSVYVNFRLSKVAETVSSHIRNVKTDKTVEEEWKDNRFAVYFTANLTDLDPGIHILRVIAMNSEEDERVVVRRKLEISSDLFACSVYLINSGITAEGNSLAAEFTATGLFDSFECQLDRLDAEPCTSPFEFHNLSVGRHRLKIMPAGCLSKASPYTVKFTVNSNGTITIEEEYIPSSLYPMPTSSPTLGLTASTNTVHPTMPENIALTAAPAPTPTVTPSQAVTSSLAPTLTTEEPAPAATITPSSTLAVTSTLPPTTEAEASPRSGGAGIINSASFWLYFNGVLLLFSLCVMLW